MITRLLELFSGQNDFLVLATLIFILLIFGFLFNFFTIFLRFLNASGCFAAVLLALIGLPSLLVIFLIGGHTSLSIVIIILSVIGVITGYITRDTKGNTGTFGYFLMILSIIILVIMMIAVKFWKIF